jgi:hypothetical protein
MTNPLGFSMAKNDNICLSGLMGFVTNERLR